MPTLKERLEKLEKELADLNAKHSESHQQKMRRYQAPTGYAENRADTARSKVELKRREIAQKISVLQQKLRQGGTRRRRRGGNRFPPIQKHTYRNYDKHLSDSDRAKEAAEAAKDTEHANATRKKYVDRAKFPAIYDAAGAPIFTIHRLRAMHTRGQHHGPRG